MSLLREIAAEARKLGISLNTVMNPGIPECDWPGYVSEIPLVLPAEVKEFYSWQNGVWPQGQNQETRIMPGCFQLPIADAKDAHAMASANNPDWSPHWFPIFTDSGGTYFVVQCCESELDFRKIIMAGGDAFPHPAFYSLEHMLRGILQCYRLKAYFLEEDGYLAQDYDKAHYIYRSLNCGLSPWN